MKPDALGSIRSLSATANLILAQSSKPIPGAMRAIMAPQLQGLGIEGRSISVTIEGVDAKGYTLARAGAQLLRLNIDTEQSIAPGTKLDLNIVSPRQLVNQIQAKNQTAKDSLGRVALQISEPAQLLSKVSEKIPATNPARILFVSTALGLVGSSEQLEGEQRPPASRVPLGSFLGIESDSESSSPFTQDKINQIATQLQKGVARSGLFYESHLERWVMGKELFTDISEEPQFDWSKSSALTQESSKQLLPDQLKAGLMANQQINLMENPKILLTVPGLYGETVQIEIFPDEIKEDRNQDQGEGEDSGQQRGWNFSMSVELSNLGPLKADFRVLGEQMSLLIWVLPEKKQLFESHLSELRSSMGTEDVSVSSKSVETP